MAIRIAINGYGRIGRLIKVSARYDNERGFSNRILDNIPALLQTEA